MTACMGKTVAEVCHLMGWPSFTVAQSQDQQLIQQLYSNDGSPRPPPATYFHATLQGSLPAASRAFAQGGYASIAASGSALWRFTSLTEPVMREIIQSVLAVGGDRGPFTDGAAYLRPDGIWTRHLFCMMVDLMFACNNDATGRRQLVAEAKIDVTAPATSTWPTAMAAIALKLHPNLRAAAAAAAAPAAPAAAGAILPPPGATTALEVSLIQNAAPGAAAALEVGLIQNFLGDGSSFVVKMDGPSVIRTLGTIVPHIKRWSNCTELVTLVKKLHAAFRVKVVRAANGQTQVDPADLQVRDFLDNVLESTNGDPSLDANPLEILAALEEIPLLKEAAEKASKRLDEQHAKSKKPRAMQLEASKSTKTGSLDLDQADDVKALVNDSLQSMTKLLAKELKRGFPGNPNRPENPKKDKTGRDHRPPGGKALGAVREIISTKFPDAQPSAVARAARGLIQDQCVACRAPLAGEGPRRGCSRKCGKDTPHEAVVAAARALKSLG